MTETIFGKNLFDLYFDFLFVHVPSTNMEGAGLMTSTAVSRQRAMEIFWLHFWGAVMTSIFIYSLYVDPPARPKHQGGILRCFLRVFVGFITVKKQRKDR